LTDQPTPVRGEFSRPVAPVLLAQIVHYTRAPGWITQAVEARTRVGVERYGDALHTHNGRNSVRDLTDEILDALQYLAQASMEGRISSPVYVPALAALVEVLATIHSATEEDHA